MEYKDMDSMEKNFYALGIVTGVIIIIELIILWKVW